MKYLEKASLSNIFIVIFHLVGFLGFSFPKYHDFFISFVPFHLLLMAGILLANQKELNQKEPSKEEGFYKYEFPIAAADQGKTIYIVFGAAMTDTEVKINGKSAGPIHQGGFYEFKYDISSLLKFGSNNLYLQSCFLILIFSSLKNSIVFL